MEAEKQYKKRMKAMRWDTPVSHLPRLKALIEKIETLSLQAETGEEAEKWFSLHAIAKREKTLIKIHYDEGDRFCSSIESILVSPNVEADIRRFMSENESGRLTFERSKA